MLAAARLAVPLVFHHSVNTFQATRSENDTEFHRASEGSGGARPRQPAGAGSALRPPVPSRRLTAPRRSHESRSFGHLRNAAGPPPLFLPLPEDELVSEAPQLPQRPGTSQRPPPSLPSPGPSRPAASLPAGGTRRGPSPAAGQRSPAPPPAGELLPPQAAPDSQHGRGKAAGAPAEKDSARKVSLSLPGRPQPGPNPGRPGRSQTALLTRYTPLRPPPAPLPARPRSYTPRRGTGSGTPPGGRGRRHLGREGILPQPRAARRAALEWGGRRGGGPADSDPRVAPRGRGILQARDLPHGVI